MTQVDWRFLYSALKCSLYAGLGFRQLGAHTYLMVSTNNAMFAILVGDGANIKKVGVALC